MFVGLFHLIRAVFFLFLLTKSTGSRRQRYDDERRSRRLDREREDDFDDDWDDRHPGDRRRDDNYDASRRRRREEYGRDRRGTATASSGCGVVLGVMAALCVVMVLGMFFMMFMAAIAFWLMPRPPLPARPPLTVVPAASPAANPGAGPAGVVVATLAAAPQVGTPGALPWAALATGARTETFPAPEDAALNKALADLKSSNPFVVESAAKRLTTLAPVEAKRKEARDALREALANPFPTVPEAAAQALGRWGTGEDVPELIRLLGSPSPDTRAAAMSALASLKDDRGAAAIAQRLTDFLDRDEARQALQAMGPVAEKAVLPLLNDADPQKRVAACGVLQAVGTRESLPALEIAAHDTNPDLARAAGDAAQAIKGRP